MNSVRQESNAGRREDASSPHSNGSIAATVGVVNNGVEGLIHPLPEHHGRGLPEGTKAFTSVPSTVSLILGPQ